MPTLKDYNKKLVSLRNTRKMTKTMQMVSATKFQRALAAQARVRPYALALNSTLARAARAAGSETQNPLCTPHTPAYKALIIVLSSDRGLCGSFNHGIHRAVARWITEREDRYTDIDLICCSRKSAAFFRGRQSIRMQHDGASASPTMAGAMQLGDEAIQAFLKGDYDEVHLAYNEFINAVSRTPRIEILLPAAPPTGEQNPALTMENVQFGPAAEVAFEPAPVELFNLLIPQTIRFRIFSAMLETAAGEHGARMSAMDNATKNSDRLIETFTLLRNRVRQAGITRELAEIVTGAEALKG
ncbi:MAG: ATP synthase F1 subunit gamma [Verrucomicrobia bacterium]|nr:MAG: ATP synthase F1 subunit gamma [Verrucomicrobiota bacterium]